MKTQKDNIQQLLKNAKLRLTPQRLVILEALLSLNHPNAEELALYVRKTHPNIAVGTVYKTLETFLECQLITKVDLPGDSIRYDAIQLPHHHLVNPDSGRLEDYYDDDLFALIENYLKEKPVQDFDLKEVKLQIIGKFTQKK